ncbi:hypothetical protein ACOMCU_16165 [Lysinibacillus sp. UGB7]|uniref:hypothetical protein n=1 Tax=Lysinibacillus sp. UGB7 TaxID=3411039 RepID=UPI003B7CD372
MVNNSLIEKAIEEEMQDFKKMLSINKYVPLSFNNWQRGKSGSYSRKGICIDLGTVTEWYEQPYRTKYVLAHELVHAKFNEIRKPWLNIIVLPAMTLEYLMSELRANTIAFELLGQDADILVDYFNNFYVVKFNNPFNVNNGYLSGKTNVYLIKQNPSWNEKAIEDAIDFFTKKFLLLKICVTKNQKEKIKRDFKTLLIETKLD